MRRLAFLTLEERGDFVIDDEIAIPALEASGWRVDSLPWRRPGVAWERYDLVVVRSTWDYWESPGEFLDTLARIDRATRLANPLALMRWNLSKTYLRELEAAGVTIVPSLWGEELDREGIDVGFDAFPRADLVVKPQVGGNGEGVLRLARTGNAKDIAEALARFRETPYVLQPYRPAVTSEGETSLFWIGGSCSHAIRKRPAPGEFRSQEERGARIESIEPDPALLDAGAQAVAALPKRPLYARIDLIRHPERGDELVELELVEPSLYFRTDPGAPTRFAHAVEEWLATNGESAVG